MNPVSDAEIRKAFPLPKFRPGQFEAIRRILDLFIEGNKYILLQAPTGSGKSVIAFTVAQFMEDSYYLAPQKFLQDQLTRDFGEHGRYITNLHPMIDLKGRNAYFCNYYTQMLESNAKGELYERCLKYGDKRISCDRGECKRRGKSRLEECEHDCPYFIRLKQAANARICLMNFHAFLFQTGVVHQFGERELLILDEGHLCEDILMKFIEIIITDRYLASDNIRFPKLNSVKEYLQYFEELKFEEIIKQQILMARFNDQPKEEEEWMHLLIKYKILLDADPELWICQWEEISSKAHRTVSIKPLFINDFADKYLFSQAQYVLMMSATLLSKSVICDTLGIQPKAAQMLSIPSTFPPEKRPIYYRPSGSMSFTEKANTLPKLTADVTAICRKHQGQRGIIHTHTFEICDYLRQNCAPDVQQRFLYQKDIEFEGDKHALIEKHRLAKDTIIIAPAMHMGLDLPDDLGRFQIICKIPYPSKADPQIAIRMEISSDWYNWRAACKLVQSSGRIIRHKNDYGVTYILDEDFKRFFRMNESLLPNWFREAVIW
jgi:Rad3-related DNA helicase